MTLNPSQVKVLELIADRVSSWQHTNDISSPLHECYLEDCVEGLDVEMPIEYRRRLYDALDSLMDVVVSLEHETAPSNNS